MLAGIFFISYFLNILLKANFLNLGHIKKQLKVSIINKLITKSQKLAVTIFSNLSKIYKKIYLFIFEGFF